MNQIIRGVMTMTVGDIFQIETITPSRRDGYYLELDRFIISGNSEVVANAGSYHLGFSVAAPNRTSWVDYNNLERDIIGQAAYFPGYTLDSDNPDAFETIVSDPVFASTLDIIMSTRDGAAMPDAQARMGYELHLSDRKETAALRELYYSRSSGA